jgi:vacuolar-type H+-ATPase subunit C/Vma6
MSNIFKYSDINAKVKAIYSKSLSNSDFEELAKQSNVKAAIIFLKSKSEDFESIDDNWERRKIESELFNIFKKDIFKIYNLLDPNSKEILTKYTLKYDVKINIEELNKKYFIDLFDIIQDESLKNIIGIQVDLLNVLWIYRLKTYQGVRGNKILNRIIDIDYKLSKADKMLLIENEDIKEVLDKTIYRDLIVNVNNIEKDIRSYLFHKYKREFREEQFSITMLICYIELRQIEYKNIINIIEGIRYKIPKQDLYTNIIV